MHTFISFHVIDVLFFDLFCFLTARGLIDDGKDTFHIVPDTGSEVSCVK